MDEFSVPKRDRQFKITYILKSDQDSEECAYYHAINQLDAINQVIRLEGYLLHSIVKVAEKHPRQGS